MLIPSNDNKILCIYMVCQFLQGCFDVTKVAEENKQLEPSIIVVGDLQTASEAYLVTDQQIVVETPFVDVSLILMAAYFAFNIRYPKNLITFLCQWKWKF